MAKVIIFFPLFCLVAFVKGQDEQSLDGIVSSTVNPEDIALQFNDVTLAVVADRLSTVVLPPESLDAGQQVLLDATDGLAKCEEGLKTTHLIWQYKVCAATQLRLAITAIKNLQLASLATTASPTV